MKGRIVRYPLYTPVLSVLAVLACMAVIALGGCSQQLTPAQVAEVERNAANAEAFADRLSATSTFTAQDIDGVKRWSRADAVAWRAFADSLKGVKPTGAPVK